MSKLVLRTIDWLGVALGIGIGLLVWSSIAAQRPAIVYLVSPEVEMRVCAGEMFTLNRTMIFERDVDLTISRALVRTVEGYSIDTVALDSIQVHRDAGEFSQGRKVYIPYGLEEGLYTLHTYVTRSEFPFWQVAEEAPVVLMRIEGRCDKGRN